MSLKSRSFLSLNEISKEDLTLVFSTAKRMKSQFSSLGRFELKDPIVYPKVMAEVFFEASTRTRLSFQMAALRLGLRVQGMDILAASSVKKGESQVETIETIAAMKPDLLVVRSGGGQEMDQCLQRQKMPVINAGTGASGHPTQALLDYFTMQEAMVEPLRVLFVGDILHSRVANSNLELLQKFGSQVAYCSPDSLKPKASQWNRVQHFTELKEALKWCNVCMGLRLQSERHDQGLTAEELRQYIKAYRLDADSLQYLSKDAIIMHPGPFVDGIDFHSDILSDQRCVMREQVTNGVYVRAALMALLLKMEVVA